MNKTFILHNLFLSCVDVKTKILHFLSKGFFFKLELNPLKPIVLWVALTNITTLQ